MEIFVRPMRYKGYHQAHNAQVVICAFFTTPNSLELQERRKAFSPIRKVRAISQKLYSHSQPTKSPQRLTRHLTPHPAVSSIGGLRTPAPVCAAPPSRGRHPQTFTLPDMLHAYLDRTKVTMLRVIPLSGQLGFTRHGDNTCSRSPSTVRDRVCSVPTHSGIHATSTLVVHLSPSTR